MEIICISSPSVLTFPRWKTNTFKKSLDHHFQHNVSKNGFDFETPCIHATTKKTILFISHFSKWPVEQIKSTQNRKRLYYSTLLCVKPNKSSPQGHSCSLKFLKQGFIGLDNLKHEEKPRTDMMQLLLLTTYTGEPTMPDQRSILNIPPETSLIKSFSRFQQCSTRLCWYEGSVVSSRR